MPSYQDIVIEDRFEGRQALFVADETNCVQFIRLADVKEDEPFPARCEDVRAMNCSDPETGHHWRRVWVIA